MKKMKKFQITCNEHQARLMSESLDNYMRLLMGQMDVAIDNMRLRFYSKNWVNHYNETRQLIRQLKQIAFPDLHDNASYGVGWQGIKEINDMYEIYKMINKVIWQSQTDKQKKIMEYSVDQDGVIVKYSKQPLIEIKEIK